MASISATALYAKLRAAGFSDAAARGIMANAAYESGPATSALTANSQFDLAALGDGGASHGLLQWNTAGGGYNSMAGAGVDQQIAYMKQTLPASCLKLGSATAVAGCLASTFERCAGCQQGGSQYNARVAAAQTLAGINFPNAPATSGGSRGGASTGGGAQGGSTSPGAGGGNAPTTTGGGATLAAQKTTTCTPIIRFPGLADVGAFDILNKCQLRALVGAGLLVGGAGVMLIGLFMIMKQTAAGTAIGKAGQAGASAMGDGMAVFMPEAAAAKVASGRMTVARRRARIPTKAQARGLAVSERTRTRRAGEAAGKVPRQREPAE